MHMAYIFGLPAALLVLAVAANRFSKLTRVPDIIVLLLIGITLGPILHWINPQHFEGIISILGTLALILILFEGGLELRLRQAMHYFPAGLLLVSLSFGLSVALVAIMGRWLLHLEWVDCLLLGAALGCTSGTIVIPALQQINTPDPVKITLTIESSLGEVIAVLLVGSLLKQGKEGSLLGGLATDFSHHIIVSLLVGFIVGAIWSRLWPKLAGMPNTNILNLGVVLGVYAVGDYFRGSGLLTVLVFGVTLSQPAAHSAHDSSGREDDGIPRRVQLPGALVLLRAAGRGRPVRQPPVHCADHGDSGRAGVGAIYRHAGQPLGGTRCPHAQIPNCSSGCCLAVWSLPFSPWRLSRLAVTTFSFLPAMAFTVVLVTNLFIVWGAVRAGSTSASIAARGDSGLGRSGRPHRIDHRRRPQPQPQGKGRDWRSLSRKKATTNLTIETQRHRE